MHGKRTSFPPPWNIRSELEGGRRSFSYIQPAWNSQGGLTLLFKNFFPDQPADFINFLNGKLEFAFEEEFQEKTLTFDEHLGRKVLVEDNPSQAATNIIETSQGKIQVNGL